MKSLRGVIFTVGCSGALAVLFSGVACDDDGSGIGNVGGNGGTDSGDGGGGLVGRAGSSGNVDGGPTDGPVAGGTGMGGAGTAGSGGNRDAGSADRPPLPSYGVGKPCKSELDCSDGFLCLNQAQGWPDKGYCTSDCESDADCGGDAFCSPPFPDSGGRVCFQRCDGNGSCADKALVCTPKLSGFIDLGGMACVPGNTAARDGVACQSFYDCRGNQVCLRNAFSMPTGSCLTLGCTPGNDATCAANGDGICLPLDNTGLCIDGCGQDQDCRVKDGFGCVQLTAGGPSACLYKHLEPGQPCVNDIDCGPAPWECLKGPRFPNGYCGARACNPADDNTCPFDAKCVDPNPNMVNDHYCAAECQDVTKCAAGYICELLPGVSPATKGCVVDPRL